MKRLLMAASTAFFAAGLPWAATAAGLGSTWTVPQCLKVWEAVSLMADSASPNDCIFGTTGEPGIPPPPSGGGGGGTGFLLLQQSSGHILLQQGGVLKCQSC